METLRIAFSDHYPLFKEKNNRVWRDLSNFMHLELVGVDDKPDLLVFGDSPSRHHWRFNGFKVYLTQENQYPDFNECDLAFSHATHFNDPRSIYLPYYAQTLNEPTLLIRRENHDAEVHLYKPRFCSFVVSNPRCWKRNRFFKQMNRLKHVDSGGMHFNNLGSTVDDKVSFLKNYRFNIAFENAATTGYITEKLVEPLLVGSIPIYWGDPEVQRDFDLSCMINAREFPDLSSLAKHVIEVDRNNGLRLTYLKAPVFRGNIIPVCLHKGHVANPIINLIKNGTPGKRIYRKRRIREHIRSELGWGRRKLEQFGCKLESFLWKAGIRI